MMVTGYTKWQEIQRRAIGLDKRPNRDVYKRKKMDQTLSGVQGFDRRSGKPLEETEKSIAALQSEVKKILHAVVDTRDLITGRRTGASDEHSGVPIPVLSISADYYLRPANPPFVDRNEVCLW